MAKSKTIALVDCDTLLYSSAAACEARSIEVLHKASGRTKEFKNRTEFKAHLAGKNFEFVQDDYSITEIQVPEPEENMYHIINNRLRKMQEDVEPDSTFLYIAGLGNFRDSLLLPTKYKANRSGTVRPLMLSKARDYLTKHKGAIKVDDVEVDEVVVYRGYEELKKGNKPILMIPDKDALQYSGLYVYDYNKSELGIRLIPDLGELWWDDKQKKVKGWGFLWYCVQNTLGDRTDGFIPYALSGARFGDKAAYTLFKDVQSTSAALELLIEQYKKWYPSSFEYTAWDGTAVQSDYKHMLNLYHKCSRMTEVQGEEPDFTSFAKARGVEL